MASLHRLPTRLLQAPRPSLPQSLNPTLRHASSSSIKPPRKPIVLEKPTKFNPPSHSARLPRRSAPRGAALPTYGRSEQEKKESARKQYPHMMPPEGTFLHWFLTNRSIHVWITMSILTSLAFFTWLTNFLTQTPYRDQLPPNNFFFSHPLAFISQYMSVYKLHTEYVTQQTAEHRRQKVEDVRKRSEFRKAHGLESGEAGQGLGGWTVKSDDEVMGPGMKEGGEFAGVIPSSEQVVVRKNQEIVGGEKVEEDVVAREGGVVPVKRPVKKWLGIW